MPPPLTFMAVHAHPDDETLSTGGVLAMYSAAGVRTIVVTCTDGAMGDGPGGVKPGEEGHDEAGVVATRRAELEESCRILGVSHLEMLGYRDSGMDGWAGNGHPDAFCNVAVGAASARVADLMERYRPQVVVTYDENGNYGHPDHIQAHRVAVAACEATGIPVKLYYTAIPRSMIMSFADRMREAGLDPDELGLPRPDQDDPPFGTPDDLIGAIVDVSEYAEPKYRAVAAHSSQTDNSFFRRIPEPVFKVAFGTESFVRRHSAIDVTGVEADLFTGLR